MAGERADARAGTRATAHQLLRVGVAALLLGPGASKLLTYARSVAFFAALGLPQPEVLVLVVGAVELGAAALLLADRAVPTAAVVVVPVMLVAAATAGPTWQNLGVILAALALLGLEAGEAG